MKSTIKKIISLIFLLIVVALVSAFMGCYPNMQNDNEKKENEGTAPPSTLSATITAFDGGTITNDKIFMFVENDVNSIALSGKVHVSDGCSWKLFSDKLGRNEIITKVAASDSGELLDGDNNFYIFVSSKNTDDIALYELTIYRSYEVEITYWFNDNVYKIDTVYTGHPLVLSEFEVDYYKLNYWQDHEGNRVDDIVVWDNISLYANASYLRKTVNLEMNLENAGFVSGNGDYFPGECALLVATPFLGYKFVGWYQNENKISEESSFSLMVDESNVSVIAKFEVDPAMRGFTFYSFSDNCVITDITDKSIQSLVIPDYVTEIGENAFRDCLTLSTVTIGKNIKRINIYAFQNCNLVEEIYFTGGINEWCNIIFNGFISSPHTLYFENRLAEDVVINTTVPSYAFYNCTSIKSITFDNEEAGIGSYAFSHCTNLIDVSMPKRLEYLSNGVFENCTSLSKITLPSTLTSIGENAFFLCSALQSITIPASVTRIGINAFYRSLTQFAIFENPVGWGCFTETHQLKLIPREKLEDTKNAARLLRMSEIVNDYKGEWNRGD